MCAVNLNYLNESQILRLQRSLSNILSYSRNGYYRYWRARNLGLKDILDISYRTYREDAMDKIQGISPSTLRFIAEGIRQEQQRRTGQIKPLPPSKIKERPEPEVSIEPEEEEEKLPPEIEKAAIPPKHPDEYIDIKEHPPEEELEAKGLEAEPEPVSPPARPTAPAKPAPARTPPRSTPEEY
jgi:hypothetical protein